MIVHLHLKKDLHREYLNYLFEKQNDLFLVTRKHDFGKLICSRVRYINLPLNEEQKSGNTKLVIPNTRATGTAGNHWLYFTKEDQQKLADELEAIFNIDFDRYYLQGRKLDMQQKDIIQSFIINRKLFEMTGDVEMLKKREYRDTVKNLEIRTKSLLKKAQYRNERIEYSLLKFKQQIIR